MSASAGLAGTSVQQGHVGRLAEPGPPSLSFRLHKRLGSFELNAELSSPARRLVLFGPSGSGKSLTMQCLAGLIRPDDGFIELPGGLAFDAKRGVNVPPDGRRVGYVPQASALFPHLDVAGNVAYGLRREPPPSRREAVARWLRLVRLEGFESRRPGQLSGGEQQRVALARALAPEPSLLLLDEPFSALDTPVRAVLRQELLRLQQALGFSWVFVTHDLEEAYLLADDIAIYEAGRILQAGPREQVLYQPRNAHVARLAGFRNVFPARPRGENLVTLKDGEVTLATLDPQHQTNSAASRDEPLYACVRQEDVRIVRKDRPSFDLSDGTTVSGEVVEEQHLGFTVSTRFRLDPPAQDVDLWVDVALPAYRSLKLATDKRWLLFIPREAVHLTPGDDISG